VPGGAGAASWKDMKTWSSQIWA